MPNTKVLEVDNSDLHLLKQALHLIAAEAWGQQSKLVLGFIPGDQLELLKVYHQKRISKIEVLLEKIQQELKA